MNSNDEEYVTLKWGTLKSWKFTTDKGKELIKKYAESGMSLGAAQQKDSKQQKEIICDMIDHVPGDIFLDWDNKYVSKEEAKKYVMEYETRKTRSDPGNPKSQEEMI